MKLLKTCGPQILLCLFMVQLITLKQLKSLTAFDKFSLLGCLEVTHPTAVVEVPGSIAGSGKGLFIICYVIYVSSNFCLNYYCHEILLFLLQW